MIEFGPRIFCSICKAPKRETNRWFRVWPTHTATIPASRKDVFVAALDPAELIHEGSLFEGEEHACGESCLQQLISRMVRSVLGIQPEGE